MRAEVALCVRQRGDILPCSGYHPLLPGSGTYFSFMLQFSLHPKLQCFKIIFFSYVCTVCVVHVCRYTYMCLCMYMMPICACVDARGGCWVSPSLTLEASFLPGPLSAVMAASKLPESTCLYLSAGAMCAHGHTWIFAWVLGIQTWVLMCV